MTYFVLKQIACPAPATLCRLLVSGQVGKVSSIGLCPRVLSNSPTRLTRMAPDARDLGDDGPPFRWIPERRALIQAELDAAMMHIYGLNRGEVEHVLDSFPVLRRYEERDHGEFRTKRLVLEFYDRMADGRLFRYAIRDDHRPSTR